LSLSVQVLSAVVNSTDHSQNWFQQLPKNLTSGLEQGSMYALIALGYTLVYGVLQLINFAHSEVFMFGGFGSWLAVNGIIGKSGHVSGVMVPVTFIVGALVGAASGAGIAWTLEKVAYRTLRQRGAPKLAFLISAIGASLFLSNLAGKLFNHLKNNSSPLYFSVNESLFKVGGANITLIMVLIVGIALVMMVFLDRLVNKTKLGRSIRAVSEDAPTAALMGIDIDKTISRTFVIGGALAGIAGFMFGTSVGVGYLMGFTPGVKAFAAAVLGGIGNVRGAMLGGLLLGEAESLIPALPGIGTQWVDVVSFVVLVLVLMFRPTGILGERLGRAA
jgi:branched-chain amino acid transport system permease protein